MFVQSDGLLIIHFVWSQEVPKTGSMERTVATTALGRLDYVDFDSPYR